MTKPSSALLTGYENHKSYSLKDKLQRSKVILNGLAASIDYQINEILETAIKEGPKTDAQCFKLLEAMIQDSKQNILSIDDKNRVKNKF